MTVVEGWFSGKHYDHAPDTSELPNNVSCAWRRGRGSTAMAGARSFAALRNGHMQSWSRFEHVALPRILQLKTHYG